MKLEKNPRASGIPTSAVGCGGCENKNASPQLRPGMLRKPEDIPRTLNRPKTDMGCGTCGTKCVFSKQMGTFPPQVQEKLKQLVDSLKAFKTMCENKSTNGIFTVDSEVRASFKAIHAEVTSFQREAHLYPEMPKFLAHLLYAHGNPLIKEKFLN